MAILKTDRERRILGDRILSNRAEFEAIDEIMLRLLDRFSLAHDSLRIAIDVRHSEENQEEQAREKRAESKANALKLYTWAFHQLNSLAIADWNNEQEMDLAESLRTGIFPMGAPSALYSTQRVLDGLDRFTVAQSEQETLKFPPAFIERCLYVSAELKTAINTVGTCRRATQVAVAIVLKERAEWDLIFGCIRDVSASLLRLDGNKKSMAQFFRGLTSIAGLS